jgi:hypothetical protein
MQPEISLRCASCGASVREPAMFCPECGKPLARSGPGDKAATDITQPAAAGLIPVDESWTGPELGGPPEARPAVPPIKQAVEPKDVKATPLNNENRPDQTHQPGFVTGNRERTRERLHRASSVARGALEDNVKRVEKIHHVSTAMLEEAAYDPSLRFVLVAIGLFLVFIILLVLSKVMG